MSSPTDALARTLLSAHQYLERHPHDEGLAPTFQYFTTHPVAPLNRKRLQALLDFLWDQFQLQSDRDPSQFRVLDLACGGGLIASAISSLGFPVLGLDASESEIKAAREFAKDEVFSAQFEKVDLTQADQWQPLVEARMGGKPQVVVLAYALHHLPGVESFLTDLARWMSPGTHVLINEENPRAPLFRLKHRVRTWIQKDTEQEWHRTYDQWKHLLEERNFLVSPPLGLDPVPFLGHVSPHHAWSLVFTGFKR